MHLCISVREFTVAMYIMKVTILKQTKKPEQKRSKTDNWLRYLKRGIQTDRSAL